MINVTKTYLPPFEEYTAILRKAWDKGWITNHGELVHELERKIKEFLNVENFLFCGNGTVVLQMALKVFNIKKEVITTPFSYVATTNAILWEGCTPVFVDIEPETFCIDTSKIDAAITKDTEAILATHVYGLPCDIEKIEAIAKEHNLKVIYDGAHAFGCNYKNKSLLNYGDISTCSFHATKIFHTGEGGSLITKDKSIHDQLNLYRAFGHKAGDYYSVGINGKNSEMHAAMGLAVLPNVPSIIAARKEIFEQYDAILHSAIRRPVYNLPEFEYNYSYYPVLFQSENRLIKTMAALQQLDIYPRRYFYPSLNKVPQVAALKQCCPVSEDISSRVLCLPLYPGLTSGEIDTISSVITKSI